MAAVLERLREELAARRAAGQPFAEAWPLSVAAAVALPDGEDWRPALQATRFDWNAAYDRRPRRRRERAVLALAVDPERERVEADVVQLERRCPHCDEPLPTDAPRRMRYCSGRCRRRASERRTARSAA